MKNNVDYVRIPVKGSQDAFYIIKASDTIYDVYHQVVNCYPWDLTVFYNQINLDQYSEKDIDRFIGSWGHKSLDDFKENIYNERPELNPYLALIYCIVDNQELEGEIVFSGGIEEVDGFFYAKISK